MNDAPRRPLEWYHPGFFGRIGLARAVVTPPLEIYARNWGAATHDRAERVHRPLTLNALVLSPACGEQRLVLLEGDLSWWRALDVWRDFQRRLLHAIGLDAASLIFSLTHTHAAPPLMASDEQLPGGDRLGPWLDHILSNAVELIDKATSGQVPSRLEWHGGISRLATVRDLPDPETGERIVCGFNPAQEADSTLLVGRITGLDGELRGVLVNYACHPTTLAYQNLTISPDFVGAMRETIEHANPGALAFFLQGASGELAPRDQYTGDVAVADRHGRQLGHAVLATLFDMQPPSEKLVYAGVVESGAPLATWRAASHEQNENLACAAASVTLPLKDDLSIGSLERELARCPDRAKSERLRRRLAVRRAIGQGAAFDLPLAAWRVGDSLWIGSMAEAYSTFQQEIRAAFPGVPVVCMNLVNGSIGYLPPRALYQHDVYQVWQTPFAEGSLERLIEASRRTLQEFVVPQVE